MLEKLVALRKKHKMSQSQVAKELEISRSTYSGYENGYFKMPIDVALKIKKLFKTKDDNIFLSTCDRK